MKQAIRSSGANITVQHIEDVSLCGLFLLDAAKKVDEIFGVHKPSTKHTVRDPQGDTTKICSYLIDNNASKEDLSKKSILTFDNPETKGLERVAKGWIKEYLSGSVQLEEDGSMEVTMDEDDLYYEL